MADVREPGTIYVQQKNSFFFQMDDDKEVWLPCSIKDTGLDLTTGISNRRKDVVEVVTKEEFIAFMTEMAKRKGIDTGRLHCT